MGGWEQLKSTGLPALGVLLPSFLWLALTCAVLQALVLPLLLAGRRQEYYIASRAIFTLLHRPLLYLFEYSGSKVFLHGKDVRERILSRIGHDQCVIVANHNGDLDWLLGLLVLDSGGGLGCCKAIIKRSLLAVPFFGFVWWGLDFLCIRRSWAADSATLAEGYRSQHAYREYKVPYALTIFPEGTRLTPKKLLESQEFAQSRGLPLLAHVLCPRTKGLWSAVNGLRLDAVYDATLPPALDAAGGHANLVSLSRGVPCELHIHMERFEPADIPCDEEGLGRWLFGRWELKERRLQSFCREGRLAEDGSRSGGEAAAARAAAGGAAAGPEPEAAEEAPELLRVRPSAGQVMLGAVLWWLLCTAAFARGCLRQGLTQLLGGCCLGFVLLVASLGAVLHQVHLRKEAPGDGGVGGKPKAS